MKKFLVVLAVAMLSAFAFAQDDGALDMSVQTIIPEDQHVQNKTAQIRIEYIEGLDEVRIYYTCLEVSFKEDEAREAIRQCLNDFRIQKGYLSYEYLKKDRTSYKKDERGLKRATYMSQVKFLDRTLNKFDVVSEDKD